MTGANIMKASYGNPDQRKVEALNALLALLTELETPLLRLMTQADQLHAVAQNMHSSVQRLFPGEEGTASGLAPRTWQ